MWTLMKIFRGILKLHKTRDEGWLKDADVIDTVLLHVGEFGRYQKLLLMSLMPLCIFYAFVYFGQMFIAATPDRHWCSVPELYHLDVQLRRNLSTPGAAQGITWDKCHTYKVNWSEVLLTLTPPDPKTPVVECHQWEFELNDIPYPTVVTERGWVCQYARYEPIAQTMFFGGSFVGGLLTGFLGDLVGRVPTLVVSNIIASIGAIATTFTVGFWDFAFCRLLVGMTFFNLFVITYILLIEYVGLKHRALVTILTNGLFSLGSIMLPVIALYVNDWRTLLWVTSMPSLTVVVLPLFVPESTRWLLSKGDVKRTLKIFKRFEKINGTKIPEYALDDIKMLCHKSKLYHENFGDLIKRPLLRFSMIVLAVVHMANALIFDVLVRVSDSLGEDFFITFSLLAFTEIPSIILMTTLLKGWGHREIACISICFSGIFIFMCAFVPKGHVLILLVVCARFFSSIGFNTVIQWGTEMLPTAVRVLGSCLLHSCAIAAIGISPYIAYTVQSSMIAFMVLGVISLVSSGVVILLPETMDTQLPQTMADGEDIVMKQDTETHSKKTIAKKDSK